MSAWTELGDRCWVRRYDECDLNIGLVVGSAGAVVIVAYVAIIAAWRPSGLREAWAYLHSLQ